MAPLQAKLAVYAAILLYIAYRLRKLGKWQREMAEKIPGPPVSLLKGNIDSLIEAGGFTEELFTRLHDQYGKFVHLFLFPNVLNVSVEDPVLWNEVYHKTEDRPNETYIFLWYLGKTNLMFAEGPMIKKMRLRYGEMISQREVLERVHAVSLRQFGAAADSWVTPSGAAPRPIPLFAELGPLIYDVMGSVMFDTPWLSTELGREVYSIHKYLIMNTNRWVLWPSPGPLFLPGYLEYCNQIRRWRTLVGSLIDQRAADYKVNPKLRETDKSAVNMVITSKDENGNPFFSRDRAISTLCGFLNGAYDTTHATSYWCFFHLAKYPENQKKILEEFALYNIGANPSLDDLRKCDFLHAFLLESLHHRATVAVNQRVNKSEDITIGEYVVPKGVNINIPMLPAHKNPEYFGADALSAFRPERFMGDSPEAVKARASIMPFGKHRRMCVGQTFALSEIKAMMHAVITRAHVELADPSYDGAVMLEAGVNQPIVKAPFVFKQRDLSKIKEEENMRWWLEQVNTLDKFAGKVNVATTA